MKSTHGSTVLSIAETSRTGSEEECWAKAGTADESTARMRRQIFQFIGFKARNCTLRLSLRSRLIQCHRPIATHTATQTVRRGSGVLVREVLGRIAGCSAKTLNHGVHRGARGTSGT